MIGQPRRVELDVQISPAEALRCLRGDSLPFAFVGAWADGEAILGSQPVGIAGSREDPFALLDRRPMIDATPVAEDPHHMIVGGGWFGFLGYGLGRLADAATPPQPPACVPLPLHHLAFYDHVLRRDSDGRWWFEMLWTPHRAAALADRERALRARLSKPPAAQPASAGAWSWSPSLDEHARAVASIIGQINAGDLYQANLALRLEGRVEGDPLDLFCAANAALPTDRGAYVSGDFGSVVSLSPELFLSRRGDTVRSAPIKGTRPCDSDAAGQQATRDALAGSVKDRAENTMIVDLVRNDLGRVCEPGTVRVASLCEVHEHAGVWHMVSEIEGTLSPVVGDGDLLRATFPPGSVTGAPKLAAMAAIAKLEPAAREAYTGAIGFASPVWGAEWSVAIRTLEVSADGHAWIGVGGAVVADSSPEDEAREAVTKVAPVLGALGAPLSEPIAAIAAVPAGLDAVGA